MTPETLVSGAYNFRQITDYLQNQGVYNGLNIRMRLYNQNRWLR